MTDDEFALLDELYFVIAYDQLQQDVGFSDEKLSELILDFYERGWVKILETVDMEVAEIPQRETLKSCYFLASKKGLQAHNSQ